ncbi:rhomboid family intramembrane serine protease [bacterium]|nr:rhomboid family intramembrane serine protease [bacterium]
MILLVPVSPEVPRYHRPTWGVTWIIPLLLIFSFFHTHPIIEADQEYIDQYQILRAEGLLDDWELEAAYLSERPLLKVAIAPKSWSIERALFSNFLHGGVLHLALNVIGVIAGVRICTTFIPFICTLAIFILGGSLGLLFSALLYTHSSGDYVPHLGASAGLFALMGTYYVYNFRFRTTYFFWFPSKQGLISLKTSWFFFLDVLLLELLLSTSQFLPQSYDGVDHLAHVGGFLAGCILAVGLRLVQSWPSVLQTRGEFLYWSRFLGTKLKSVGYNPIQASFVGWTELLKINFFNDQLKKKLVLLIVREARAFSDQNLKEAFIYFGPTFVRLHLWEVTRMIRALKNAGKALPEDWLRKTPYDIIIRLAQNLVRPGEEQTDVLFLITSYQVAHRSNKVLNQKLAALLKKMEPATKSRSLASGE